MIKSKYFLNAVGKIAAGLVLFGSLFLASCGGDEEGTAGGVSTVQFTVEQQTVSENVGAPVNVLINFDKAAGRNGTITIAITEGADTDYTTHYLTNPNGSSGSIELTVSKGQTSAQFTFTPVNNALLHDDRTVEFTIADVTTGFEIGTKDANVITITDDEGPTRANFSVNATSIAETLAAGQDVTINLTNAAPAAGTITISFTTTNAAYTTNFTTAPAATSGELEIPVNVGATSVTFKVTPVDDGSVNAARVINFTIAEATGGVEVGTTITAHAFTITDNETPSVIAFDDAEGTVDEGNAEGIVIPLTLTPATNGTGTVVVTFTGADYGDDFTTEPAAVGGQITINVATAATTASFKVIPVDDTPTTTSREITFTLSNPTGVVTLGATDNTFDLTIEDDDAITTIADVRAAYPGTTTDITSSLRIRGVVTSSNPQVNTNNIWVQDATGGIVVRLSAINNNSIERGDEVSIQLNGGQYFSFNGLLQVQNVPNANVTIVNEGVTLPTPEVITVAQLNSGAYEGKLVRLNTVAFVDANGTATMSGTRPVSDGTTTTNVRTETGASHATSVLPYGFGTVTGLAAENLGAAQIIPIVFADDVFVTNPIGTINVTQAITAFGTVNNGAQSTSQQFTVSGTTLTQSIVVSASAGFEVSLDDAAFSGSVTLSSTGGTVYVRFAPVSGTNQTINGTITSRSLGAAPVSFNVSGIEAGNPESDLKLLENFTNLGTLAVPAPVPPATTTSWVENSGTGTNNLTVTAGALTFAGYPSSNVGNGLSLATTGQDAYKTWTGSSVNSGDVYAAFLMTVTSAQATGDYFFALLPDNSATNYTGRTFIKSSGAGFVVGISKGSVGGNETLTYGTTEFSFNTTYLVVIKYTFVAGATNDVAAIHVLSTVPGSEPGAPEASSGTNTNADQTNLGRLGVRQGGATNAAALRMSGLRVATTWADLFE